MIHRKTKTRSQQAKNAAVSQKSFQRGARTVTVLLLLAAGLFFFWQWARIDQVRCNYLDGTPCNHLISAASHQVVGDPLLLNNHHSSLEQALIEQPVTIVRIEKKFPRTLLLTLEPERFSYILSSEAPATPIYVTESGKMLTHNFQQQLDLITIIVDQDKIAQIQHYHQDVRNLMDFLSAQKIDVTAIIWDHPNQLSVELAQFAPQPVFRIDSWNRDLALALHVLTSPTFATYRDQQAYLDARFTYPVLRSEFPNQ